MLFATASERSRPEYWTAVPNLFLDHIAPELSDTERAVAEVVIRQTRGYHRTTAHISNRKFMKLTGKSEPAVIRAKRSLEDLGLLICLKRGGGRDSSLYALDLYYDTRSPEEPARYREQLLHEVDSSNSSKGTTVTRQAGSPPRESDARQLTPDEEVTDVPDAEVVPDVEVEVQVSPAAVQDEDSMVDDVPAQETVVEADQVTSEGSDTTEQPAPDQVVMDEQAVEQLPDPDRALDTDAIEDGAASSPNAALVPYEGINSINYSEEIHTEAAATNDTISTQSTVVSRGAIAAVRYEFNSLFPEAQEADDYPFYGWCIKTYGLQVVIDKLTWLREYRREHKVLNAKGLLRMALVNDYQPSARTAAKLQADARARWEAQRWRQACQEREEVIASFDYDAAQRHLQELLDSLN